MPHSLLLRIFGSYRYRVESASALDAVACLRSMSQFINDARLTDDGYCFTVFAHRARRLSACFDAHGIRYERSSLCGLPRLFPFALHRPALILGAAAVFVVAFLSSRVVWGFELIGCDSVPHDEVLLLLDELGCGIGDYIPTMDLDRIHARFLAINHDISWIAVNFKGNLAYVEVIETRPGADSAPPDGVYANVVAAEDAQLYLLKTACGRAHAKDGDVVRKGDVLISGVIDVKEDRVRYEYAKGEALAYVPRTLELELPFEREEKSYTGRTKTESSIKIFKKSINLFSKGGIEYSLYDKIEDDRQVCLFGRYPLPVYISRETQREYEYVSRRFTAKQSESFAKAELHRLFEELLERCDVISNRVSFDVTDSSLRVRCDLVCLTDIARSREFTVGK